MRRAEGRSLAEEAAALSKDFRSFVKGAWELVIPTPLVWGWHMDAMCEHIQAAYEREIYGLIVTIPPGFLKSGMFSVFAPAWRWTHAPWERFLSASHGDDLATRDNRKSRMLMQTGWYQARWHDWEFARDENLKTRYSNNVGGSRTITHVGGGTGERGTVLVLDDPHDAQEMHSEAMLQTAVNWWGETWASRLDDHVNARGIRMVIGQRLGERDLIGHLLANDPNDDRWTHLCLPFHYKRKHPFVYPEKVKLPSGRVLTGDQRKEEDELLAPGFMDTERFADKTAEMTAQTIAAQFQQLPAPAEGNLLKRAHWRYFPPEWSFYAPRHVMDTSQLPKWSYIVNSWDTSVKDRAHSDFVAGGVWGIPRDRPADRWLLRLWHNRAGLNATIEAMVELHEWAEANFPGTPVYSLIESAANGPDAIAEIRKRVQGVQEYPPKGERMPGDKRMRAEAAQPALDGGNCYLPGYANETGTDYDARTPTDVQKFIEETAAFDQGQHDDLVDHWSQMVNWTRKRGRRKGKISRPRGEKPRPSALPG